MALWLVGQLHSPEHAREVQHLMEYYPAPPLPVTVVKEVRREQGKSVNPLESQDTIIDHHEVSKQRSIP